jgi:hypothetical protein
MFDLALNPGKESSQNIQHTKSALEDVNFQPPIIRQPAENGVPLQMHGGIIALDNSRRYTKKISIIFRTAVSCVAFDNFALSALPSKDPSRQTLISPLGQLLTNIKRLATPVALKLQQCPLGPSPPGSQLPN